MSPRLVAWIAVTVAIAVVAYLIGHHRGSATVTVVGPGIADLAQGGGTAYIGAHEPLNAQPYGFAYSVPPYVEWSDSSGGLHDGSRPPCLPVAQAVHVKNIEAVQFTVPQGSTTGTVLCQFTVPQGSTTGTVLWVQC
jgi:hypothetical protein